MQAGVDRKESERDARLKETFTNLQRLFPGMQIQSKNEDICDITNVLPVGVRGRVVDLCKPTQRKYETAVSVILGRNIDAVVVDQEKTAIECIEVRDLFILMLLGYTDSDYQYMRNQRAGQATFIPLDTIQVKPINDKFRSIAKGARLAVDVIQFDPVVERAMHHACGNALVCDTMEIARHVCYDKGQEVKGKASFSPYIITTTLITCV